MKKNYKILALLMAMMLLLSACGGSKTSTETTENSGEQETAKVETSEEVNYDDVVINYGMTTAWDSLNPYGTTTTGSLYTFLVHDKIFDRLAFVREGGSKIEGRGAESWEQGEDGKTAIFHLNPNAKFHDGEPVTAEDWVFTLQLISDPEFLPVTKSEFNIFEGTDDNGNEVSENSIGASAIDEYTLQLTFKNILPVEDYLLLKGRFLYVLPKHILGEIPVAEINDSDYWKAPIGSGPCVFLSEIIGSSLELGAFKDYHLGAPKFGKIVMPVIASTNTITSVMSGELDYFFNGPSVSDAKVAEEQGLNVIRSEIPTGLVNLIPNNQNISDKRVRQAIDKAVDKQLLLEQATLGEGVPASMYILPTSKYANKDITWSRDVEGAKKLLEEAGWDSSRVLKMAIAASRESQAAIIQQNLAEVGIEVEIFITDVATMFAGLTDGTYDLGISGSTANDYPIWMEGYYDYRNKNYAQITDTRFAEMQGAISSELDPDKRMQLVMEYQEFMHDEMPIIYLWHAYSFAVTSDRLTGINPFDSSMYNDAVWEWEVK